MEFHLKMSIVLKKELTIEAENLKDARKMAEKQLMEEVDFNSLEVDCIGLDMTDSSIREYLRKMCQKRIKEYKEKEREKENEKKH